MFSCWLTVKDSTSRNMVGHAATTCFLIVLIALLLNAAAEKYRFCVVDGKGHFKRSARYCPELDKGDSKVECVVALDRLDCLRRIQKGKVDFSVLTPEDLVTATNAGVHVLVTNELRYTEDPYEYEVVAVIDKNAGINNKHDLKNKRFCHPGYGYEADWTKILANFLEASIITPQCNPKFTMTENRIRAASEFFNSACKAGPWVNNVTLDRELKRKYQNLCSLCGNTQQCTMHDQYWGRKGSLLCLTDGAGDVSWSRWDDVRQHFGLVSPDTAVDPADDYRLLCPDNSIRHIDNKTEPCVWVAKPWPVVAARRVISQEIQSLLSTLSHVNRSSWESNLLYLLETSYLTVETPSAVEPIESYLHRTPGYLSANSFSSCHPPRTIKICTTSVLENVKCSWLRESAAVYGIEPDLDCLKADNITHCMMGVEQGAADLVMVPADQLHTAVSHYNLKPLFYETVNDQDKYVTVVVTKRGSKLKTFEDLKGAKACFPTYDGVAWNSVIETLYQKKLISSCSIKNEIETFFGPSCVPGLSSNESKTLVKLCEDDFSGEFGALLCVTSGAGDVAFVSKNSVTKFVSDERPDNPGSRETIDNFEFLCDTQPCHLSWSPVGYGMVRRNRTELWLDDTLNVFQNLDNLFGKNYKSITTPFTMFGRYDGHSDVLFHDATVKLRSVPVARDGDNMPFVYEDVLASEKVCVTSIANTLHAYFTVILIGMWFVLQM